MAKSEYKFGVEYHKLLWQEVEKRPHDIVTIIHVDMDPKVTKKHFDSGLEPAQAVQKQKELCVSSLTLSVI